MEGWQKRTLGSFFFFFWQASITKLGWFSVSQSVIAYFSLCTTGSIWGRLPLEVRGCWCGYARRQKMCTCWRADSPAGCCCVGWPLDPPEVRQCAGRNTGLFGHHCLCFIWPALVASFDQHWLCFVQRAATLDTPHPSHEQSGVFIAGNCFITVPERNKGTKYWVWVCKHCTCKGAEQ